MGILKTQSDIIYYTAEETGLSKKHVEHIEQQFWGAIRYYLTHPLLAKGGILIQGFGKFFMKPFIIKRVLNRLLEKSNGETTKRIKFYKTLLEFYGKENRQASKQTDNG